MSIDHIIFIIVLLAAMFISYKAGKLTLAGTLTGGLLALFIFLGAGFTGIAMLATFFVLSVMATSHRKKEKSILTIDIHQKRNAGQVLANGAVAALFGLLMFLVADLSPLFAVLMAAALASATADTLSSELGTLYGSRFYNIVTFKPDERGRDGVVSVAGTLIGIVGAAVIAIVYGLGFGFKIDCLYIIIAGTVGSLTDSVLGATLERKGELNNDAVNFSNTVMSALTAFVLMLFK